MDFQQSQGHLPPPPPPPPSALPPPPQQQQPPMTDMYHHHHQQQQQTLPGPPAPNPWYSTQFQYQHSSSPPPPQPSSYPPPPHQPWPQMLPQSHPDHYQSAPPPPPPPSYPTNSPYQAHHPQPQHNQYPPPPHQYPLPPLPPRPHNMPPPHQIPQNYPQVNQEWGNANWVYPQSWEYQANNNEEAWAAKARAWASAKVAPDSQPAPYIYAPINGNVNGDSTAAYSGRDSSYSSLVHQQEVSSSYSSIAGDPVRGVEPAAAMPFGYTYVPPADPGFTISSVPAVTTFAPQVDPSAMLSSPLPTHSVPVFGRMPGPSFHASVSSVGPSFSVGAGPDMHTVTALSGDAYGVSGVSERPKKASVPNWLREEIIKNKPALVNSAAEPPKEDTLSNDDDGVYKSYGKNDMADSRSADSSRSVEDHDDDDDDEDEVEAARTAAINKEIKRVLTEVLLKVTDELFDEIATKVLTEDDPSVEANSTVTNSDEKVVPTTNGFGRVGALDERKGTVFSATREKSAPSSTGDLLGLSSYVSDDDEDDERQSSEKLILNGNNAQQQVIKNLNFSEGTKAARDSDFLEETRKTPQTTTFAEPDPGSSIVSEAGEQRESRIESTAHNSQAQQKMESIASEQVVKEGKLKDNSVLKNVVKIEKSVDDIVSRNSTINDSLGQEKRVKSDKGYRHEDRKISVDKDHKSKQLEGEKETASEKGYKTQNRHEERLDKTEKRSDQKVSRDRLEDKVVKSAEKMKDSDSKRRSPPDLSKELEKEKDKERANIRDDGGRKRERTRDVKRDESRHANGSSSSKHRRRRSSSVASRDRDNIDSLVVSHASDISNESSDYSKRKPHSRRQRSPSPATVKSRKRQVSRSPPHSKHSQHRHSSYSSLEASRRRRSRSRSRSPIRRRR